MHSKQLIHSGAIKSFQKFPNKLAVIDKSHSMTYQMLFEAADHVASEIIRHRIAKDLVAVLLDKSVDQVVASLGVTLAGCAYFPVDPTWPEKRINDILNTSETKLVITNQIYTGKLLSEKNYSVINIDQPPQTDRLTYNQFTEPTDLAYVIFTSGSTGTPKGVAIEHHSVQNTIDVFNKTFSVTESDCVLSLSPVSFDLSVYDTFGLLSAGGTIVIPAPENRNDPKRWLEHLKNNNITLWNTAPALGQMLVDYVETMGLSESYVFPKVKVVALGGDWVPLNLPDRLRMIFPNATIMSGGGSTETSIWGCWYIINKVHSNWRSIPYGKAIEGQRMQLFREHFTECQIGEIGEIFFSGIGLAREYWKSPNLTDEKFIFHPKTGERFYKSGDLGRLLSDGNIEFISRIDQQVQINGYRVEIPEIEKQLLSHPKINRGIILDLKTSNNSARLAAAVVLNQSAAIAIQEIRDFLAGVLPSFMVPHTIMILDKLPLSKHGKVDKIKLQSLFTEEVDHRSKPVIAPKDDIEKEILSIWKDVLGIDKISTDDSFLSLGGTSILAVSIIAKIELRYSVHLPTSTLLGSATVSDVSEKLRVYQQNSSKTSSPILLNKGISYKYNEQLPLILMHPGGGSIICYDRLGEAFSDRKVYAIEFPYHEVRCMHKTPNFDMDWLSDLYVKKIKTITQGPCLIGGWSAGGAISYATTKKMEKLGTHVPLLIMIDSACANVYRDQKEKVAKVNEQAISFYINELNKYLKTAVTLNEFGAIEKFDLSMYLPDLIRFIYNQIDTKHRIKCDIPLEALERFIFTFEGTVRAGLDVHLSENVEEIFFIKAEQSDQSTVNGWKPFSRKEIQIHEIPNTSHMSIIESKYAKEIKDIISNYTEKLKI